jgi:hypothetical protein
MRFTVVRLPEAEATLTELWTRAITKSAISEASNEIDRLLNFDPVNNGQIYGRRRRIAVGPLEIIYTISLSDRLIKVVDVRLLPSPNGSPQG